MAGCCDLGEFLNSDRACHEGLFVVLSTECTARLRKNALCDQFICDVFPEIRRLCYSATKPVAMSNFCTAWREFYLQLITPLHFNTNYLKFFIALLRSSWQWHLSSFLLIEVSCFISTPDLYFGCTWFEFRASYWIYVLTIFSTSLRCREAKFVDCTLRNILRLPPYKSLHILQS